jgi:hypothetical protein
LLLFERIYSFTSTILIFHLLFFSFSHWDKEASSRLHFHHPTTLSPTTATPTTLTPTPAPIIKPNILYVIADDLSIEYSGPNMQAMADNGVDFQGAYCQYPICGPSRSSFLQYTFSIQPYVEMENLFSLFLVSRIYISVHSRVTQTTLKMINK